MSREQLYNKYLVVGLILLGSVLRLSVFLVSPPNNAYDDHLEVINIYAQDFNRPTPFQCWQCYQPPLYYYVGSVVYNISKGLGVSQATSWKVVQAINPILSIVLWIVAYQILLLLNLRKRLIALVISFLIVLPRDIFTSAMIGNDYMLVFFSVLAFFFFLKTLEALKNGNIAWYWVAALVLAATFGSLTKQHGILLHLFPGIVILLLFRKIHRKMLYWTIPIVLLGALFSLSEEVWKYNQTGEFLVSNQHYFDYAKNQYPGSIEKVEFFNFRIISLYKDPFISEKTSASFFTELFARTFYDYEWRFISPKAPWANSLGFLGYSIGLLWGVFFITIIVSWIKQFKATDLNVDWYKVASKLTPMLLALLFMMVPFLQTLRFPYFSSMKSMFMLPGIILLILTIGSLVKNKSLVRRLGALMIVLNLVYAILLVIHISLNLENSLNHLHGPLWPIP